MILKADKTLKGPNVKIVSWMIEIEGSSVCLSTTALKSCHPHLISELPTSCQLNIVKKNKGGHDEDLLHPRTKSEQKSKIHISDFYIPRYKKMIQDRLQLH